jgi:hypothetical protein
MPPDIPPYPIPPYYRLDAIIKPTANINAKNINANSLIASLKLRADWGIPTTIETPTNREIRAHINIFGSYFLNITVLFRVI